MARVRARRIVAKQSAPRRAARSHGVATSGRRPKPRAAPAPLLRGGPTSAGRALKPVGGAPPVEAAREAARESRQAGEGKPAARTPPAAAPEVPGALVEWRAPDWRPPEGQSPQRRAPEPRPPEGQRPQRRGPAGPLRGAGRLGFAAREPGARGP